eukprot:11115172-Ditylum_brightwellii.AAC.1
MKTGKAAGPFANITDALYGVAIEQCSFTPIPTNVQFAWQYLWLFAHNITPCTIQQAYSSEWLTLLHKAWPINPSKPPKCWPIGPGVGSCQAVAAIIIKAERKELAKEYIHHNNLGIRVHGGSQFVAVS